MVAQTPYQAVQQLDEQEQLVQQREVQLLLAQPTNPQPAEQQPEQPLSATDQAPQQAAVRNDGDGDDRGTGHEILYHLVRNTVAGKSLDGNF